MILTLNDWLNNCGCSSVALTVHVIDRRGPSTEMRSQLQLRNTHTAHMGIIINPMGDSHLSL